MKFAAAWKLIRANLGRHRRRSVTSSLGIALGIAALVFLVGLGQGVRREVIDGILAKLPLNELIVTEKPGLIRASEPLDDAALELLRSRPGVTAVHPALESPIPSQLRGISIGPVDLPRFGTDLGVAGWDAAMIEEARAGQRAVELGPNDVPVVISTELVDFYNHVFAPGNDLPTFSPEEVLGTSFGLILGRSSFETKPSTRVTGRVVGFSPKAMVIGVTIPLEVLRRAAEKALGSPVERYSRAYLVCEDSRVAAEVGAFAREAGFETESSREAVEKAGLTIDTVTAVLSVVGVLMLLIAAFSIFNNFSLIVTERGAEIGLLRCVGCTRSDVRTLILGEATVVGLANGAVGALAGWGLGTLGDHLLVEYLPEFTFKPETFFHLPWWLLIGSALLAVLVSVGAAALPARRAARIPPAEALRRLEA